MKSQVLASQVLGLSYNYMACLRTLYFLWLSSAYLTLVWLDSMLISSSMQSSAWSSLSHRESGYITLAPTIQWNQPQDLNTWMTDQGLSGVRSSLPANLCGPLTSPVFIVFPDWTYIFFFPYIFFLILLSFFLLCLFFLLLSYSFLQYTFIYLIILQ